MGTNILSFHPMVVVAIFSYRKVSRKIWEHNINLAMIHQSQRRDAHFSAHEIRISKSLFVVVFAFMLCWVPAWLITILARFVGKVPRNVQLLCAFFVNLSNAINPFIYAGMNPLFRLEFKRILPCVYCNKIRNESARTPITINRDRLKEPSPLLKAPHSTTPRKLLSASFVLNVNMNHQRK